MNKREKERQREKELENKQKLQQTLKARIDQLCKVKGYTYYNLAYKSSVPITTLLHVMNGESANPGLYTIVKICDGLDMTLMEFFNTKEFEDAIAESRDEK